MPGPIRLTMRKRPVPPNGHSLLVLRRNLDDSLRPRPPSAYWFENVLVRNGQDQEAWERNQKCKQDGPIIEKRQLELGAANDKRVRAQPGADQKRKQGERDRNGIEPESASARPPPPRSRQRKRACAAEPVVVSKRSTGALTGAGLVAVYICAWIAAFGGVEKLPLSGYWYLEAPELWKMGYRRCAD